MKYMTTLYLLPDFSESFTYEYTRLFLMGNSFISQAIANYDNIYKVSQQLVIL